MAPGNDQNIVGNGGNGGSFHKRSTTINFSESFKNGVNAVRRNLIIAMGFTIFLNVLVLAIPIYLFQISDRVLTSRSIGHVGDADGCHRGRRYRSGYT